MDGADNDFGSNSPVVFPVGGTSYVAAVSKNGHFFLLNAANFGGTDVNNVPPGGAHLRVSSEGIQIHTVIAAYASSMGAHFAFSPNGAPASPKGPGGTSLLSVAVRAEPPQPASVARAATMP